MASTIGGLFGSLTWLVVLVGVFLAFRTRKSFVGGPTLVLRKFEVHAMVPAGPLVEIAGRASGLVAWMLTQVGLDTETRLTVTNQAVLFRSANLSGEVHERVLLVDIASTRCAYAQPLWLLLLGGAMLAFSFLAAVFQEDGSALLGGILIAASCGVVYALQKKMAIVVETSGGETFGVCFKRSVIEGVSVDMGGALRAIETINDIVARAKCSV